MSSTTPLASTVTFGDLLRQLRRRTGLTQGEFAALIGFSIAQVSRLEQNQRLPDLAMIAEKFVPALGLQEEPRLVQRLLDLAAVARGERPPTAIKVTRAVQATIQEELVESSSALPLAPTALIGRERTLAALTKRLMDAPGRLVTLVGAPGVGKTRLALAVATQVQDLFADGAQFIPLAAISDPDLVPAAIISALGLTASNPRPPLVRLIEALRRKEMLLVLDNFEQVSVAAPLVAQLLEQCAGLRMLVTSREPLRLRAEQRFKASSLEPAAAVELFVQRAQAINSDFALTPDSTASIAQICLQLDCLPLAIELVAARSELFTPGQLLDQLQRGRLNLLEAGVRDLPDRHQTLRNAIAWSYRLLPPTTQQLFRWLGVFVGGFDLDAVRVIGDWLIGDSASPDALLMTNLQSLIANSLVVQSEKDSRPRYSMLETIREFAVEQLAATSEDVGVRQRHAHYFLTLAASAAQQKQEPDSQDWLERNHDNLRAALRWFIDYDHTAALQLANTLYAFWYAHGYYSEARAWLTQALALNPAPTAERALALLAASQLADEQGEYTTAHAWVEESLMLFRSLADQTGMARALHRFGWLAYNLHDVAHAVELFQQSLQDFRAVGDQLNIAHVLSALAHVIGQQQTAQDQVTAYLDESLTIYRSLGCQPGIASVLKRQGLAAALVGNDDESLALLGESLAIYRQTGAQRDIAWTLEALGETEWLRRNLAAARRHLVEAQHRFTELGDKLGISLALHHLAQVERGEQRLAEAKALYQQCLHLSIELENRHMIARCLAGLGGVALGAGQPERAARLLAVAQALFDDLPPFLATGDRAEYDALIAEVRTVLGETAFVQLWTEGRSLELDDAVAYAF